MKQNLEDMMKIFVDSLVIAFDITKNENNTDINTLWNIFDNTYNLLANYILTISEIIDNNDTNPDKQRDYFEEILKIIDNEEVKNYLKSIKEEKNKQKEEDEEESL